MPIETTEHGTVYTQAEIDREFVARAKVRDEYVPKADHLRRLESKNERINALQGDLVSVRASVSESSTYVDRIAELEDRLHAQTDRGVYADLGLLDAEGTPDEAKLRHFRWVFDDHVSTLDAPPEDKRAAFREWLRADDGARADSLLGGMLSSSPPAAPGSVLPRTPAPPVPPAQPAARASNLTPAQLRDATLNSPEFMREFRALTPEARSAKMQELRQQADGSTPIA
jgi:hypothetical protein